MTKQAMGPAGKINIFVFTPDFSGRLGPAPSTHRLPPTSCTAPFKLSHRPPLDTQRLPTRPRIPPSHGQPPFSKAARRLRRRRRQA